MNPIPPTLEEQIGELYYEAAEVRRRMRNRKRTGKVVEVDAARGKARVQLCEEGEYKPFTTPWIPWREYAMGNNRSHMPPSVGQQVTVVSENGDLTDAEIDTSLPSEDVPRPSDRDDEYILSLVESTLIRVTAQQALIQSDRVDLGGEDGKQVARKGDLVHVATGSSAGLWPIVEGSEHVWAID